MDATPINPTDARPLGGAHMRAGRASFGQGSASALSMKWSALHDAAGAVAVIAGLAPPEMTPPIRNFPAVMRDAGGWRRELAEQGIADLSAIMEPGLAALLNSVARGANPRGAAEALWSEFESARDGLMALSPPPGAPTRRMA